MGSKTTLLSPIPIRWANVQVQLFSSGCACACASKCVHACVRSNFGWSLGTKKKKKERNLHQGLSPWCYASGFRGMQAIYKQRKENNFQPSQMHLTHGSTSAHLYIILCDRAERLICINHTEPSWYAVLAQAGGFGWILSKLPAERRAVQTVHTEVPASTVHGKKH